MFNPAQLIYTLLVTLKLYFSHHTFESLIISFNKIEYEEVD